MKKTKILHINTMDIGGGAARIAYDLNEGINKYYGDKFESTLLVGRRKDYDNSNIIDFEISKSEINFNGILTRMFGLDSVYSNTFSKHFTKEFIDQYDVIHLHNIHGYFFDVKLLELLKDKKVVWTFHDMWPITGHCAYSYECQKWKKECNRCELKQEYPKIYLDTSRKMYKMKKTIFNEIENLTIVTPSQWLANKVKESFLKDKEIIVINNGIDSESFYPRDKIEMKKKYNVDINKKAILFLAADIKDKRKGFRYLIKSLNNIDNPEEYILVSVGTKLKNEVKLDSRYEVIELGYIYDKNKLAEIYSLADVFVIPSLADNFPCTIQESLMCNTPCVGFDVGGIGELIVESNGDTVLLKDTVALSKSIQKILNDNIKIDVDLIKYNYCLEKFIDSHIQLYNLEGQEC